MRSSPKRMPNSSRPSRYSSAPRNVIPRASAEPPGSSSSLRRSASTTSAGAFFTKPSLASFFSARSISASQPPALLLPAAVGLPRVERVGGQHPDHASGHVEVGDRLLALGHGFLEIELRQAGELARRGSAYPSASSTPRSALAGPGAHLVAVAPESAHGGEEPAHVLLRTGVQQIRVGLGPGAHGQEPALAGQQRPDLLGHEGHDRVQQQQRPLERVQEHPGHGLVGRLVEPRLGQLEVPVAHLRPEGAVEVEHRGREAEGVELPGHALGEPLQPRHDPAVLHASRPPAGRAPRRPRA